MPKNKRPVPRKSAQKAAPVDEDDALAQAMADLALDAAMPEDDDAAAAQLKEEELNRMVLNALRKKNDAVLYDAIERARFTDVPAYQLLRSMVEDASGVVFVHREGAPDMEINAFAVPVFVHCTGGLKETEAFNDPEAFDALVDSFTKAGLESPDAKVMLVAHAYDPAEASRITYCQLNDIVRGVYASMTAKKLVAVPALETSITGWTPCDAAPEDPTVELRFLLGFALKRADDPFCAVPEDEAAAEAWFDARMERYRAWTEDAAPLVRRCLAADPEGIELSFLYQDLVFGAMAHGFDELATLRMMSQLNQALEDSGTAPQDASARVVPAAGGDDLVLRITLTGAGGNVLTNVEKPLDVDAVLEAEVEDVRDALGAIGIAVVAGKDALS
ncbi:hypothetical protein [Massilia cavernae]|uniref:DUF2863 family protein n=1 Tax=Massilia cavernae TaxID=2320864 RepID=A0A418Y8D7_9BURK|nr:hypothetical protein [Massilia cavernae]RJG27656.1 hypothetical protein D3872_00740 [Massilia cavernae]